MLEWRHVVTITRESPDCDLLLSFGRVVTSLICWLRNQQARQLPNRREPGRVIRRFLSAKGLDTLFWRRLDLIGCQSDKQRLDLRDNDCWCRVYKCQRIES